MLNKIVTIVEDNITTNPKELPCILEKETGYPNRQLAEAFSMLTNTSIKSYHTIRRLEYAAQKLINDNNVSIAALAQEVCYNDQAAFTNAFKKQFNITPSEAKSGNIVTRGIMKINFSIDWGDGAINIQEHKPTENSFFGLSEMKLEEVQELLGLAAFYGMNNSQANIAYDISKNNDIDFDSAFEFLNDYLELCTWDIAKEGISVTSCVDWFVPNNTGLEPTSLKEISQDYIYMYCKYNMFPTEAFEFIESYYRFFNGINLESITDRHIELYRIDDYNRYDAEEIESIISASSKVPNFDWEEFIWWFTDGEKKEGMDAVEQYLFYLAFVEDDENALNDYLKHS